MFTKKVYFRSSHVSSNREPIVKIHDDIEVNKNINVKY